MRCLFCKEDSSNSRSIEHIVPESLGNKSHVLPPRVVCDRCNNYFARKVEKPFLESTAIMRLRFDQELQSKRGIIPPAQAVLLPNFPALIQRYSKGPLAASVWMSPEAIASLCKQANGALIFPAEAPLPTGRLVSRFLAKMGLEAMALRLLRFPDGLDYWQGSSNWIWSAIMPGLVTLRNGRFIHAEFTKHNRNGSILRAKQLKYCSSSTF